MTNPRIKTGNRAEVTVLCRLIGRLRDARTGHRNARTVLPISPERGGNLQAVLELAAGTRAVALLRRRKLQTSASSFIIDSPDRGMQVYDVLRQDGFRCTAANPMVFATPLLCDAQWRFVWPMLRTE